MSWYKGKELIIPSITYPSNVSLLPPSHVFDEEESEYEEGPFGDAHSPSELNIKYQTQDEEEDYYQEDYYTPETRV